MRSPKKTFYLLLLMLAAGLTIAACEGPAGSEGPRGPEGPEGPVGPAGEDGSVIHAGDGAPAESLGDTGDYYLDKSSGELYGPKNEDGWGAPINLKGADGQDGQDGEDGSQIFSGATAPDASTGSIGDYYLNTDTYDLYGPKTDSGWGTPINLKGTANVMYTSWFEPVWDQVDEARHKRLRITDFKLTSEFKEGGVVLVYHRDIISSTNYTDHPLPHTVYFVDGNVARVYRSYVQGNGVYIEIRSYTADLDPDDYDAEHNLFRYVLIPGSEEIVIEGEATGNKLPVDVNSYGEVKRYYGIRD